MKIRPVGTEFFHAVRRSDRETDRRTDMTQLIVALRNFANAPKNCHLFDRITQANGPLEITATSDVEFIKPRPSSEL